MKKNYLILLAALFVGSACRNNNLKQQDVWVPVYKDKSQVSDILALPPQSVSAEGKVYAYRDLVFQLDQNQGIHVYRLEQNKPVPLRFIQVYGAQEISIKDGYLYTNNFNDVVVLNIADNFANSNEISVVSRLPDAFSMNTFELPPSRGYFQCVDSTKGIVVGWEKQHNVDANCIY